MCVENAVVSELPRWKIKANDLDANGAAWTRLQGVRVTAYKDDMDSVTKARTAPEETAWEAAGPSTKGTSRPVAVRQK
jgi:hypothetical protein